MNHFSKILAIFLLLSTFHFLISPNSVSAQIINIWEGTSHGGCNKAQGGCDFCDALIVTRNIILYLLQAAIAIAVGMMIWGAILLMTAGGSEERTTKARGTITSAVIGVTIALTSWLIVNTIIHFLANDPTWKVWNTIRCT